MLSFYALADGKPAQGIDLSQAYLVGTDEVALRSRIAFNAQGILECEKESAGPAGLAIPWPVKGTKQVLLETSRLMDRDMPYVLQLELVRGRLIRTLQKFEDWGMFEYEDFAVMEEQCHKARDLLIEGINAARPAEAARLGDLALEECLRVSDTICERHANTLFKARAPQIAGSKKVCGVRVRLSDDPALLEALSGVDFVCIEPVWREVEPKAQEFRFDKLDAWVERAVRAKCALRMGPLVNLRQGGAPAWIAKGGTSYEVLRDSIQHYLQRLGLRYGKSVSAWCVCSGLHAESPFSITFEQVIELTQAAAATFRKFCPSATLLIEIAQPWGEYYAHEPKSIPPHLYAEVVSQSAVQVHGIGLDLGFARDAESLCLRDFFQIADVIDRFGGYGLPLHITRVEAPSSWKNPNGWSGWGDPWSETVQAAWAKRLVEVAMARPFVESITWGCLRDEPKEAPGFGLLNSAGKAKPIDAVFRKLRAGQFG